MSEFNRRTILHGGLVVVLMAIGLACAFVLLSHSSMRKMFLAEFDVANRSGENIYVTLLGKGPAGRVSVLPQVNSMERPGWYRRPRELPILNGGRRSVAYNWDDIQFLWIAVRSEKGPWHIVRTGLGTDSENRDGSMSFQQPDRHEYEIPPLKNLPDAPAEVAAAASR